MASLRALRLNGSAARTHGWEVGLYSGKMTSPAGTQNQEIDCLSPEAQRLVRGTRGSVLCLSVTPSPRRAVSPEGSMVKGSDPPQRLRSCWNRGGWALPESLENPEDRWLAENKTSAGGALKSFASQRLSQGRKGAWSYPPPLVMVSRQALPS